MDFVSIFSPLEFSAGEFFFFPMVPPSFLGNLNIFSIIFIHFPFFWGPSWSKSSRISFPGIAVHPLGLSHPGSAWVPGSQAGDTAAETART